MTEFEHPATSCGNPGSPWLPNGPAVVVEAVGAISKRPRSTMAMRAVAVLGALALAGGGVVLTLSAGSSTGGSDSPTAAVTQLLESLSHEDLLGAAEVIVPSERDTLIDSGVSISAELVRLGVLSDAFDLSALTGVDLRFDNLSLREVPVRSDITQVFIDRGSSRASVDVAKMPLGGLITDRAPEGFLTFTDSIASPIGSRTPIAVVERDGRWYVSLWYSVAENFRVASGEPVPSTSQALVPIGADSPEAAVERLIREAARLDPRTTIGMLDPQEMSALYDYSPLFLPQAESAANETLQSAVDSGVTWTIDSIELSSTGDDELAAVTIDAFEGSLISGDGGAHVSYSNGDVMLVWTNTDFMGGVHETTYSWHDGCLTAATDNTFDGYSFDSCNTIDDTNGESGIFGSEAMLGLGGIGILPSLPFVGADAEVVAHNVDGKWFVSPTRTLTGAIIAGLKSLDPDDLAESADSLGDIFNGSMFGSDGFGYSSGTDLAFPFPEQAPQFQRDIPTLTVEEFGATNADLIKGNPLVGWALDLLPDDVAGSIDFWVPDLEPIEATRGIEINIPTDTGEMQLTVAELATLPAAIFGDRMMVEHGGVLQVDGGFGGTVLVTLDGNRLLVLGAYGDVPIDDMRALLDSQIR